MQDITCYKKVCIYLIFIDYILLRRDFWICWRNRKVKIETLNSGWRSMSCIWMIGRGNIRMFLGES